MESLKSIGIDDLGSLTITGVKAPIGLGNDEIIELMALDYNLAVSNMGVGSNSVCLGLYRKSEKLPRGIGYNEDSDMIWSLRWRQRFVTESLEASKNGHIAFPSSIMLIRPPQMVHRYSGYTGLVVHLRLYYKIRRVSKEEIAKLMLKDHD